MAKKYDSPALVVKELEVTQQMNDGSSPGYDWEIEVEGK